MHIAYVCPTYPPGLSANGISTYTALMAEAMNARRHRITAFCLCGPGDGAGDGPYHDGVVTAWPAKARSPSFPVLRQLYYQVGYAICRIRLQNRELGLGLRRALLKSLEHDRPDLVECPEGRAVPRWIQDLGIPVVVRLHAPFAVTALANGSPRDRDYRAMAKAERRCLREAQFISAPTHAAVHETERVLGFKLGNARVIPNPVGVETAQAPSNGVRSGACREILFVGRIDILKGFDVLIKAFCQLARDPGYQDVRLRVVGPDRGLPLGDRGPVSGAEYIRETVEDPTIRSRIELLGQLPFEQVRELRRLGSITVVPSVFETFGSTIAEAMAAGCPVVVSEAGGAQEIVRQGQNGLFFRSGDPDDLSLQIKRLLNDRSLCGRLGMQARIDVCERYHPGKVAEQMELYYRQVISQAATGEKNLAFPSFQDVAGREPSRTSA